MTSLIRIILFASAIFISTTVSAQAQETCSEIGSNGVTFKFDRAYACGQFVNGDWWVLPPSPGGHVRITQLTPSPYVSGCTASGHHGFEVNPSVSSNKIQSLDDRAGSTTFADPPCLPVDLNAGDSMIKVVSWNTSQGSIFCEEDSGTYTCVENAAVLTVLEDAPPADAFRPPYVAGPKPIFRVTDLDLSKLPRLPHHEDAPSMDETAAMLTGPWLDHIKDLNSRYIHPRQGLRDLRGRPADYGAELLRLTAIAALRTTHDDPNSEKMKVVVPMVQAGIDLYHVMLAGRRWLPHAGHENGRKLPILYTGLLLDHSGMLGIGTTRAKVSGDCTRYFSEDGQTYFGETGDALFGDARNGLCGCGGSYGGSGDSRGDYNDNFSNSCKGRKSCRDPDGLNDAGWRAYGDLGSQCVEQSPPALQISRGTWEQSSYQYCCTTTGFIGTAIAARILGLVEEWNHAPFFEYADRMAGPPWNGAGAFGHPYMAGMHSTFRSCTDDSSGSSCGDPSAEVPSAPYLH